MAYVKVLNAKLNGVASNKLPFIYNVHKAVGPNCPNQRVDVLLVQYLLKAIFANTALLGHTAPPNRRPIVVDGICGPITNEAILHFQREVLAKQQKIATDGRVDRAFPASQTPHGLQWTVIYMNLGLKHARPTEYDNLPAVSECPTELKTALL